jgi:hypothetical protein
MGVRVSHLRSNDKPLTVVVPGKDDDKIPLQIRYRPLALTGEEQKEIGALLRSEEHSLNDFKFASLCHFVSEWDIVDDHDKMIPLTAAAVEKHVPIEAVNAILDAIYADQHPNGKSGDNSESSS